ncbi:uncharacterized protein LOC123538904 [Mercenaria mercenaria]|uniref:uncharacterized protein LOC123538904 n=1 Tax=Mercenaria mercenaria TaxID=6596 RepID=UPI00234EAD4B|nr:uncharacterized protein LOC123538904 [Mercenaria mercenaria]
MHLSPSNALILFALVSNVFIGPVSSQWIEIGTELRRSIGSAITIRDYFQIEGYIRVFEAYEWISMAPGTNYYWVSFTVDSTAGTRYSCDGDVLWDFRPASGLVRTPYNPRCVPIY